MSCPPSYVYRPIFTESPNKSTPDPLSCTAPTFAKHRSRLFAGGTYFRSIDQGPGENTIELEVVQVTGSSGFNGQQRLDIYNNGILVESFGPFQQIHNFTASDCITPKAGLPATASNINQLRAAIGYNSALGCGGSPSSGAVNNSTYIEMVPRGCDTGFDAGGSDGGGCLTSFPRTFMTGGAPIVPPSYIPTTGFQDPIRSGPDRTMVILATQEDYFGEPTDPPANEKIFQWNGTAWIYYSNLVQGNCPVDGPVVPFV